MYNAILLVHTDIRSCSLYFGYGELFIAALNVLFFWSVVEDDSVIDGAGERELIMIFFFFFLICQVILCFLFMSSVYSLFKISCEHLPYLLSIKGKMAQ